MIYITGDTHGEYDDFLNRLVPYNLTDKDTVIVCGDFGFVLGDPEHNLNLKHLSKLPFTIAFADGNHENFEFLNMHTIEEWCGGKVHRVEKNIVHLMRGEIFNIEGKTFYTFGGAYSIDKYMRRPNISWWEQELPNNNDYDNGKKSLENASYKVDYVISHQIPVRWIYPLGKTPDEHDKELTGYFDWLYTNLEFSKWFAGHWHVNQQFDSVKMNILYNEIEII